MALFGLGARLSREPLQLADAVASGLRALLDQRLALVGQALLLFTRLALFVFAVDCTSTSSRAISSARRFARSSAMKSRTARSLALGCASFGQGGVVLLDGGDDGLECFELFAGAFDRVVGLGEVVEVADRCRGPGRPSRSARACGRGRSR